MPEATIAAPAATGPESDIAAAEEKLPRKGKRAPQHPDDYEDAESFLQWVRTQYDKDVESDQENRDEGVLDALFFAGEQWDEEIRNKRNSEHKPTLTINRIPAFVAQLVGNRRLNDTGIKFIPDKGGTKEIAKVREGLVRQIQKESRAQMAYDKTFENTVVRALGAFRINVDYAHDDVFEQDIRIVGIPDPDAVVWDAASVDPTGGDAAHCFVIDRIPRKTFEQRYPDAVPGDFNEAMRGAGPWYDSESVQIAAVWRLRFRSREVALMLNGDVVDVTDKKLEEWYDKAAKDRSGFPRVRTVQRRYAQMHLCSAHHILAGPYELPIQRIPVFRVPGWEVFVEGKRIRWGLVRFLRDPQKLHNYWRSVIAELLVAAPKDKWVGPDEAFKGREKEWRESHKNDDRLLMWNGEAAQPPQRIGPAQVEPALIEQASTAAQDLRDVSNIHEAMFGQQSNEVSGRAITARQRVGELGSVIYQDNLNAAIEEAGRVINDLIPVVYDTPRVIKVLGEDMISEEQIPIARAEDGIPGAIDITSGKYSVSVVTGPSYATRRVEAREEMMAAVNAMPETMAVAIDEIIRAQDWPGADKIAKRLQSQLPPGVVSLDEMEPEQAQALQQQQAAQQQMEQAHMQLQMQGAQAEIDEKVASARLKVAQALKAEAEAEATEAEKAERIASARLKLAQAQKALAEIETDRAEVALKATAQLTPPKPAGNGAKSNGD